MSLLKYAYLLDQENYCIENKIFIDLMWHISRNKSNGDGNPKGMVTIDKNGKAVLKFKSYIVRNAGIMFQQIFFWHFNYIKKGQSTKYQYNQSGTMINVIKKDFQDWWEDIRLTEVDVTSANKFLIETGLITIHKMRIKVDNDTFKPSNCYAINTDLIEQYLDQLVEISKEVYKEKVDAVREKNIKTSLKYKEEKKSTDLVTEVQVTPVTQVTLKSNGLSNVDKSLSTLSTDNKNKNSSVTPVTQVTIATPITPVTIDTPITQVTIATPITDVTNNTDNTYRNNNQNLQDIEDETLSPNSYSENIWEKTKFILKDKLNNISYKTWIEESIKSFRIEEDNLVLGVVNNFTKGILEDRYLELINKSLCLIASDLNVKFIVI